MTTMTLSEASKELRDAAAQALGLPNRRWYASLADAIDAHLAKGAQVPDAIDIDSVPSWVTKLTDPSTYVAGWNACRQTMLSQRYDEKE